jgi:hypothetical protein
MPDVVLDTGPLADVLRQYFQSQDRSDPNFVASKDISRDEVRLINKVVRDGSLRRHIIVASSLAFVELVYNWDTVVNNQFTEDMLAAFIADPPDWFTIESMNNDLISSFCEIPSAVQMTDGNTQPIEWTDAVHAATTLMREEAILVTTDSRLIAWNQSR